MFSSLAKQAVMTPIRLSSSQLQAYHEDGFLVLRQVFDSDRIVKLGDEGNRIANEHCDLINPRNMRVRFKPNVSGGVPLFEVFDPIADLSSIAREIANAKVLHEILFDIYGEPACLFKDKLICKPAGAAGATLHQDWIAWPGFPESFLTVLIAIDRFTLENGTTQVYPRLHKDGYLSAKDGQHHVLEANDLIGEPVPLLLEPGDIAIFGCFTPHVSAENRSASSRRGYFISYNAVSDGGDQYAKHYEEFHAWIRNKAPANLRDQLFFK